MTTQSLRGMANHGPMHWRGDRTGGRTLTADVLPSAQPDTGRSTSTPRSRSSTSRSRPARAQRAARPTTRCRRSPTSSSQVTYPPNPIRNLDNSLTADQQAGRDVLLRPDAGRDRDPVGHVPQLQRLPRARSRRATPRSASRSPASSAATGGTRSSRRRRSSRSRTCATCIRRSGCSGWAPPSIRRAPASRSCSCRRRTTTTRSRAIRCAASASCTTAAPTRCSASMRARCSWSAPRPTRSPIRAGSPSPARPTIRPRRSRRCWPTSSSGARSRRSCSRSIRTWLPSSVSRRRWPPGRATTCRRGSRSSRRAPRRASAIWSSTARPAAARWASSTTRRRRASSPIARTSAPVADADLRALAGDADLTFTAVPPGSGRRIGIDRDLDGVLDGDEGSGHLAQVW